MRIITSETIVRTVKNLCLRANKFLPSDIKLTLDTAYDYEISPNGKRAHRKYHRQLQGFPADQPAHLPGHRHGGRLCRNRAGCTHRGRAV